MFTNLRERMGDTIKALGPKDDADKAIIVLLERGTSEQLLGPDWNAAFELVDLVNSQPMVMCEKLLRFENRILARPNAKVQLLALTMLDVCVRNCHPLLHTTLASSLLWQDMIKLVLDNSLSRIDDEVRDKILAMVEDYANSLHHLPVYQETYDSLIDQGVGFPVRSEAEATPFTPYQPPDQPPPASFSSTEGPPLSAMSHLGDRAQLAPAATPTHAPTSVPPSSAPPQTAAAAGWTGAPQQADLLGGTEEELGSLAALKRSGSRVVDTVKEPVSRFAQGAASSAALDVAGSAAQKAGGGVAALGSVAGTAAKVTPAGMVMDWAGNLVPNIVPQGAKEGFSSMLSGFSLFNEDKPQDPAQLERGQQLVRERELLERDRQQLAKDRALHQGVQPNNDALSGMAAEDRAAVQAVMAADRETATHAPAQPATRDANPPPQIPDDPAEALKVINNGVGLFAEMVGNVKDEEPQAIRDPLMTDLAEQCTYFKSKLLSLADSLTDESQLLTSLALNDTLSASMSRYDELHARALAMRAAQVQSGRQRSFDQQQQQQLQSQQGLGGMGGLGGDEDSPKFTLLDEGEDDADDESLATKREGAQLDPLLQPQQLPLPPQMPQQQQQQQQPLEDLLGEQQPVSPPTSVPPTEGEGQQPSGVLPEQQQQQQWQQQPQPPQEQQQQQEPGDLLAGQMGGLSMEQPGAQGDAPQGQQQPAPSTSTPPAEGEGQQQPSGVTPQQQQEQPQQQQLEQQQHPPQGQ